MVKRKIEFPANDQKEFMIELREKVAAYFEANNLSKYGNMKMVLKSVVMLLLFLAPYVLMITGVVSSFAGVLICWIVIGIGTVSAGWISRQLEVPAQYHASWIYQYRRL